MHSMGEQESRTQCPTPTLRADQTKLCLRAWTVKAGGGGCSLPVFAKFLQNLPSLPQILVFLCLQPPHVPVSPYAFKFHSAVYAEGRGFRTKTIIPHLIIPEGTLKGYT